ncbi:acid protease [Pyrenochaeta sp. DS3sAY3a]|nr:acid protease [Pyrenochaeta sp. DS3sAY3a]
MHIPVSIFHLLALFANFTLAYNRRAPSRIAVTENVLHLKTLPHSANLTTPSSKHLLLNRHNLPPPSSPNSKRQTPSAAPVQENLTTIGGRVYMVDVTLGGEALTLVIDSGSSDTWVASSTFKCLDPNMLLPMPASLCGFGGLYDAALSATWEAMPGVNFTVRYTGGEFLLGGLGTERFGIGGGSTGAGVGADGGARMVVNQTIGVVEAGFWMGDGISSGLMGLAYSTIASGAQELGYTSVMFTLTQSTTLPPLWSLALNRPTSPGESGGGILAIGGIPDVPYTGSFVTVPILPIHSDVFAYYSVALDGVRITAPKTKASPLATPKPLPPLVAMLVKPFGKELLEKIPLGSQLRDLVRMALRRGEGADREQRTVDDVQTLTFEDTVLAPAAKLSAILDAGSSLLYLPMPITDTIANAFIPRAVFDPETKLYVVPCSAAAPRVSIIIGGSPFWMSEDDLMNKGPGAVGGTAIGVPEGYCALAMQRADEGNLVLGDAWLKNVLVVFDLELNEARIAAREVY